jgi:hypothetical protein
MYISLNKVSDVKSFVNTALSLCGNVTLKSGRYCVDGKSILGIFSLDLSAPLELICENGQDYAEFSEFEVE